MRASNDITKNSRGILAERNLFLSALFACWPPIAIDQMLYQTLSQVQATPPFLNFFRIQPDLISPAHSDLLIRIHAEFPHLTV
jgi:hypothetical protein